MRSDAASADRKQSVREAAQGWLNAGWIERDAYQRIEVIYTDDRVRTGVAFRILFFVLVFAAIMGFFGAICALANDEILAAVFALVSGIACWGITEYLILAKKRRQGGIEEAFSAAAIICITLGLALLLFESRLAPGDASIKIILLAFSLLTGAAAWNWGFWPYMVISAGALFFVIGPLPGGRFVWLLLTSISCPWLLQSSNSFKLPPSLRKCAAASLATIILALYASMNIYVADHPASVWPSLHGVQAGPRWLYITLTAIVPIIVFVAGVLKRQRLLLILGFLLGLFSLVTLRMYVHLIPLWVALTASGILLLTIAGVLRRFLDSGTHRERAGFTADPLAERPEKHRGVEILASVATMTPNTPSSPEDPRFQGGGGEFGGGGASGGF
jgi:hypothetical protein